MWTGSSNLSLLRSLVAVLLVASEMFEPVMYTRHTLCTGVAPSMQPKQTTVPFVISCGKRDCENAKAREQSFLINGWYDRLDNEFDLPPQFAAPQIQGVIALILAEWILNFAADALESDKHHAEHAHKRDHFPAQLSDQRERQGEQVDEARLLEVDRVDQRCRRGRDALHRRRKRRERHKLSIEQRKAGRTGVVQQTRSTRRRKVTMQFG